MKISKKIQFLEQCREKKNGSKKLKLKCPFHGFSANSLREIDKFHYGVVARIPLKIYQGKLFTQKGWAGFPLLQNDFENQDGCSLGFYLSDKTGE